MIIDTCRPAGLEKTRRVKSGPTVNSKSIATGPNILKYEQFLLLLDF
jgi:hypothetical protein